MNQQAARPIATPSSFLSSRSEMGERTRCFEWSRTPLGPIENWPQSLTIAVRILLDSRFAMWLGWGPDFIFFYNDAYARMTLGPKHPGALGRSAREVWSEIWDDIGPRAESVVRTGQATWDERLLLFLERKGVPEETYHTFSYSPIPDDTGSIGGMLCVVTDETGRTIGERRLRTLRELAARTTDRAKSAEEACEIAARTLAENPYDLPFVLIYLLEENVARLAGCCGLPEGSSAAPRFVEVGELDRQQNGWPLNAVLKTGRSEVVTDVRKRFGSLPGGVWPESPEKAVVLPVTKPGPSRLAGFVVAGISPRLEWNDDYRGFLELLTSQIASAVTNAMVFEEEWRWRNLAEALPNLVWTALPDGRGDYFSSQCFAFTGVAEGDLLGNAWLERVIHPDDRQRTLACWTAAVTEKGAYDIVYRLRRHDGVYRWFQTRGVPVRDDRGRIVKWFGTCTDIEDQKQIQEELEKSEAQFRTLFESMEEGFCIIEMLYDAEDRPADYRFLEANPTFEKHTGLRDVVGRTIRELIPNHDSHWYEIYGRVAATGEATRFVNETKAIGRWFDVYAYRVGGSNSRRIGIIFSDITARKREEEKKQELLRELETQHAFVKAVISQVPAAIVVADAATGQIRVTNEEAHRIVRHAYEPGKRLEDYGNTYIREAFRPDGSRYVTGQWPLDRSLRGETIMAEEIDLRMSDDSRVIVRVNASPIRVGEQVVAGVVAFHDVTARKHEEQSARFLADASAALAGLVDYEDTLQRVARLAVPGFADWVLVDMAGEAGSARRLVVAHADPSEAELARALQRRFARQSGAGRGAANVLQSGIAEIQSEVTDAILAAMAIDESDLRLLRQLGLRSWMAVPLTVRGETVGVMTFLSSRSGRRYDGQDLAVAKDLASRSSIAIENSQLYAQLKEADRRKDEFLATLAHELRNPLAPIRNGLQLLRLAGGNGITGEKARTMMERQLGQMVRLVDDLMDVSRINQGKLELRKERIDLAAVLTSAVETSRPLVEQMGHDLEVVLPPQPVVVEADLTRLAQVFSNLLTNAAKYTEMGGRITLTARRHGGDVMIAVRDTGIGIAADQLPRIFEMFSQVKTALERSQGGLGIGLALVKRLVGMHGGRIEVKSDGPGQGSEFIVHLPVAVEACQPQPQTDGERGDAKTSLRILVVDDNRDSAESLADMLGFMGGETRIAFDGEAAVAAADEFRPDVIVLDIGLPKLNGYEACRRIRAQANGRKMVLIAQTGWGQDEDRQRTREAGFDHHLVKPVDPAALMTLLSGLSATTGRS